MLATPTFLIKIKLQKNIKITLARNNNSFKTTQIQVHNKALLHIKVISEIYNTILQYIVKNIQPFQSSALKALS